MRVRQAVPSSETRGRPSIWGVTLTPPPSMATCDDDFGLLGDDAHTPPETQPNPSPPPPQGFYLPQKRPLSSSCFAADDAASQFSPAARGEAQTPDRKKHHLAAKRRGGAEESGEGGEYCSYFSNGGGQSSKKGRGGGGGSGSASSAAGVDYRKDREEWSDEVIGSLLDAYTERFEQLKRGNLRGRDWEDVAAAVTKQHQHKAGGGWGKSVEQCKNKIDNLKKRYKVERQRIAGGSSGTSSQWPWFTKLEFIVGNATSIVSPKPASTNDDKSSHQQQQTKSCIPSSTGLPSIGVGSGSTPFSNRRWKRALLKIGGSALAGGAAENVDPKVIMLIAREVQVASRHGVQVAIVVGSRNIYCSDTWTAATGIDRAATCPIGHRMMASVMNAVLLQASLEKIGVETRVQTSLRMQDVAEPYIRQRAMRHLEKGRVVIFGGFGASMGNPLFTTDTAAALRASEINADVVLNGTAGDSVYCCLPGSNSNAAFEHISYRELVARGFSAMDVTAITFCEENNVPVVLFNMLEPGNISRALCGDQVGTLVDQSGRIS